MTPFELQSCRSCRDIQFRCRVYIHPSLYRMLRLFEDMLPREKNPSNFRSGYSVNYLRIKMISNEKSMNYKVVALD
jgi:hypothetical protein